MFRPGFAPGCSTEVLPAYPSTVLLPLYRGVPLVLHRWVIVAHDVSNTRTKAHARLGFVSGPRRQDASYPLWNVSNGSYVSYLLRSALEYLLPYTYWRLSMKRYR